MPEVAVKPAHNGDSRWLYHSDLNCEHVTDSHQVRPLGALNTARYERECHTCANGRSPSPQTAVDCPRCGESHKNLPTHLRYCDGGATDA